MTGFLIGTVTGAVVMFFVLKNNETWIKNQAARIQSIIKES